MTPLVTEPGSDANPMWSPDGQWLVYQSSGPDIGSAYFKNGLLFKVPADGGTPIMLAADLDEDPNLIDWNRGGIYLGVRQRTKREIYRVDPNSGRANPFVTSPDNVWSVHFSADGEMMALRSQTPTTVAEVYRSSVASYDPVRITNMSAQIANWELGTSEVIEWTSADGTRIEGVLHKPSDFDSSVEYPLFVVIHGGPTGVDYSAAVNGSVYPIHQWLAKGALVLRPNYRGSAGYGEAFRSLNVSNLGVGDMWDVMSGVDHLVSRGMVDTTRMAAMGWSQGGYISAFLTTNTDRFAAISVGAETTTSTVGQIFPRWPTRRRLCCTDIPMAASISSTWPIRWPVSSEPSQQTSRSSCSSMPAGSRPSMPSVFTVALVVQAFSRAFTTTQTRAFCPRTRTALRTIFTPTSIS